MSFISYASNFEDVLLNRVFGNKENGLYIDIGAAHPIYSSTTKSFYDRGWFGINVEPSPSIELINKYRPRDINIRAAITDYDGEITFYVNELEATSSIFEKIEPSVAAVTKRDSTIVVPAMTMNTLVKKNIQAGDEIDFLKIDAEGSEASIILTTNWNNFRPRIILAESTKPFSTERIDSKWKLHLENNGYVESYFDGINTWFVRKEQLEDLKFFNVPVNVLDDFVKYDPRIHDNQPDGPVNINANIKKKGPIKKLIKKIKKYKKRRTHPLA